MVVRSASQDENGRPALRLKRRETGRGSWAAETVAGRGEACPRIDVLGDRGASVLPTRSLRNCTETEGRTEDPTARRAEW